MCARPRPAPAAARVGRCEVVLSAALPIGRTGPARKADWVPRLRVEYRRRRCCCCGRCYVSGPVARLRRAAMHIGRSVAHRTRRAKEARRCVQSILATNTRTLFAVAPKVLSAPWTLALLLISSLLLYNKQELTSKKIVKRTYSRRLDFSVEEKIYDTNKCNETRRKHYFSVYETTLCGILISRER